MKLLITGFDPFGGETVNPAWEAVKLLPDTVSGHELVRLQVPTAFVRSGEVLKEAFLREKPDIILCVGQAGGRAALTVERIAVNLMDAPIPDNDGDSPMDAPVVQGGPDGIFATLPVKAMAAAAREAGVPAELSCSAGTYVCNCLMYRALCLAKETPSVKAGFVHVPFIPVQAASKPGRPSMALCDIVKGLTAMILAAAGEEVKTVGGAVC